MARFSKGQPPWNKGKVGYMSQEGRKAISEARKSGEDASHWLGEKITYSGLHNWIKKEFERIGKEKKCEVCGEKNKMIHHACVGEYNRNLENWKYLCVSCHKKNDTTNKVGYINWWIGRHHQESTKNKISLKLRGRKLSQEHKQKISKGLKEKRYGNVN